METIYYFSQKVKLGDTITFNGMNVPVTEQLIRENPSMFEVVDDAGWPRAYRPGFYMDYAKTAVPQPGINECVTDDGYLIGDEDAAWVVPTPANDVYWPDKTQEFPKKQLSAHRLSDEYWQVFVQKENAEAYIRDNKKAPLFTTVDGVDIYEGDLFYIANIDNMELHTHGSGFTQFRADHDTPMPPRWNDMYFSDPQIAQMYISDLKATNDMVSKFEEAPRNVKEGFVYWLWNYFFEGAILQAEIDNFDESVKDMIDNAFND